MTTAPNLIKKITLLIGVILVLDSCYENDTTPERVGSTLDSKITGSVVLYDDFSNKVSPEGMNVTIDGEELTAVTDSGGRFTFKDVSYGTINFIFSKAGYGTFRVDTFHHKDDNDQSPSVVPVKRLGALSTTAVTNLFAWYFENTLTVNPTILPAGTAENVRVVRFFFGTNPDVNGENYDAVSDLFEIRNATGAVSFSKSMLTDMGFTNGQTIYVKAYGDSYISNDYIDMQTGKRVFPNLNTNTAEAQSFVFQ